MQTCKTHLQFCNNKLQHLFLFKKFVSLSRYLNYLSLMYAFFEEFIFSCQALGILTQPLNPLQGICHHNET